MIYHGQIVKAELQLATHNELHALHRKSEKEFKELSQLATKIQHKISDGFRNVADENLTLQEKVENGASELNSSTEELRDQLCGLKKDLSALTESREDLARQVKASKIAVDDIRNVLSQMEEEIRNHHNWSEDNHRSQPYPISVFTDKINTTYR